MERFIEKCPAKYDNKSLFMFIAMNEE